MPFAVNSITGVIIAVGKHIIAENSLSCTHQRIGIDKPTNCGVVVPTLEIVQIRLGIVDIATIGQSLTVRHPPAVWGGGTPPLRENLIFFDYFAEHHCRRSTCDAVLWL